MPKKHNRTEPKSGVADLAASPNPVAEDSIPKNVSPLRYYRAKLANTLKYIAGDLEDYEHIDEDSFQDTEKVPRHTGQTGAQYAIRNVIQLRQVITEAEDITSKLPDSELVHEAKVTLTLIDALLSECEFAASIYLHDGDEELATDEVKYQLFKAWEEYGRTLLNLFAEFRIAASAPDTIIDSSGTAIGDKGNGKFVKAGGWSQRELIEELKEPLGKFSPGTFRNIRGATGLENSKAGSGGQQRRYSRAELRELIATVKAGNFRNAATIAKTWQKLLDA